MTRLLQRCIAVVVVLLLSTQALGAAMAPASLRPETPLVPGLRILAQDQDHLELELVTPRDLLRVQRDATGMCDAVQIAGYGRDGQAGYPWLPVKGELIGIPAASQVEVVVTARESAAVEGSYDVCPVPTTAVTGDDAMLPSAVRAYAKSQAAYGMNNWYPPTVVETAVAGLLRDQQVARLVFHPVQYNPTTGQIRLNTRLRVAVRFVRPTALAGPAPSPRAESAPFESLLQSALLNYQQAPPWRSSPLPGLPQSRLQAMPPAPAYKLLVRADGLYRLSYDDLLAAGLDPPTIDPRHIQMRYRQQEIAIRVAGEDDGSFDPGDAIEFYGQAADSKYTDANAYWLTVGDDPGLRMTFIDGTVSDGTPLASTFSTTMHIEQNHVYWPAPTASSGQDYWFWTRLVGGSASSSLDVPVEPPSVASGDVTATLRLAVKSRWDDVAVNPDHHLRIRLNGRLLRDLRWDGEQPIIAEAAFPQGDLHAGSNTVRLEAPGDTGSEFDAIYLDWLEVSYQRSYQAAGDQLRFSSPGPGEWRYQVGGYSRADAEVYDISDPLRPGQVISTSTVQTDGYAVSFQALAPGQSMYYAVSPDQVRVPQITPSRAASWLRNTSNGADYIVITHPDFYTATTTLADYRRVQGLRTVMVTTEDIYDQFSFGIFDPNAIRDFLAYAYANWQAPAPSFVLLVGDGSLDFRDYLGTGEPNYVPPMLAQVDPTLGETVSDNRYVTVSGEDPLPDMFVGRLPASSAAEATMMIAKTISYEQQSASNPWRERVVFAADNADSAGDFAVLSDVLASFLPPSFAAERIYYGVTHSAVPAARQAIIDALGRGPLFANYTGHAAVQYWAAEGLLRIEDIASVQTTPTPPILLAWSCYEGWFAYPGLPSLDESIIRAAGGAVATWSPTGLSPAVGHVELARRFYAAVFKDGSTRFGQATTLAKIQFYADVSWNHDLVDTYLVFGDPALRIAVEGPAFGVYLPVVMSEK